MQYIRTTRPCSGLHGRGASVSASGWRNRSEWFSSPNPAMADASMAIPNSKARGSSSGIMEMFFCLPNTSQKGETDEFYIFFQHILYYLFFGIFHKTTYFLLICYIHLSIWIVTVWCNDCKRTDNSFSTEYPKSVQYSDRYLRISARSSVEAYWQLPAPENVYPYSRRAKTFYRHAFRYMGNYLQFVCCLCESQVL